MVATFVFKQRFVYVFEIMLILSVEQHDNIQVLNMTTRPGPGSITEGVNFEEENDIIRFDG